MKLSSPHHMTWQYFQALRRLVAGLDRSGDEVVAKQSTALCVMLSVTVIEAFLNVFFRVLITEAGFTQHEERVLKDLAKRRSLDYKLKKWPKAILGKDLDPSAPTLKAFLALKDRRNALMHFTSTHQTIELPGFTVHGLADTSVFDTLAPADAVTALEVAEGMICEICRLSGIAESELPHALHSWTGKPAPLPGG